MYPAPRARLLILGASAARTEGTAKRACARGAPRGGARSAGPPPHFRPPCPRPRPGGGPHCPPKPIPPTFPQFLSTLQHPSEGEGEGGVPLEGGPSKGGRGPSKGVPPQRVWVEGVWYLRGSSSGWPSEGRGGVGEVGWLPRGRCQRGWVRADVGRRAQVPTSANRGVVNAMRGAGGGAVNAAEGGNGGKRGAGALTPSR